MKSSFLAGAALLTACLIIQPAEAQFGNYRQNQNQNQRQNGGGVLPLPEGVKNVISIDAHNTLLAEVEGEENPDETEYKAFIIKHVYSGGIAKVLGGTVVPTETFVSPEPNIGNGMIGGPNMMGGGGFNQGFNQGYNQGFNPDFNQGFGQGFNSGFNPGFNNQGFNNQSYFNPGFNGNQPNYNVNFQRRPRNARSARATRQLQRVIGMLDKTPRQVQIGP